MTEILQYVHKDGLFHRMAPVTKILFVVVISAISIFSIRIPFLIAVLIGLLLLAYLGNVLSELFRQFVLLVVMGIIMLALAVITLPNGETIGYLVPQGVPVIGGIVPVTTGGISLGIIMALRFAVLVLAVQIFVISTQPRDLVHTLERMRVPIDFTLMFVIALRFIPTLQIEGTRIQEAQLARGYNPGKGFIGKVRSLVPIMVPLVSNALVRANTLGLTIDMRGYRTRKRTVLRERVLRSADKAAIFLIAAGFILFIWLYLAKAV
ncbi:MAG: energy-coupling factor transporter transmembrane protein EcfT [Methanoregulaceae archaeon]|nr:energy-coupling factor transporter transmembrane protein EcfT [Methanoregulaceae archaeon]